MGIESVLVTGSSGTIGTALSQRLLEAGYTVYGVDIVPNRWSSDVDEITEIVDLRKREALADLPANVDIVIHLAANARVHNLVKDPEQARENIDMTINLLEWVRQNDIPRFVFASSREVYGDEGSLIHAEPETQTDECESPYTASKISGEAMVDAYQRCYGIDATILRFSNVYGRYDASDRVVPLFIALAYNGNDLTVFGEDKVLDFTYIDDCIDGIFRVVDQFGKASSMTLNIASGTGTSLVELAYQIQESANTDAEVEVEPNRTGEVSRAIIDCSRAEKLLGYSPEYSFEDGLEETIQWYLQRKDLFDEIME